MYFSPNLVKNYSHNFFPQNLAQFFSQNLVTKFTPQKFTKKMALKITKFGENLVTKFSFTNFGDILVHFIFTKFGDSLKFSPNLVNIFSILFSTRTLGLLPPQGGVATTKPCQTVQVLTKLCLGEFTTQNLPGAIKVKSTWKPFGEWRVAKYVQFHPKIALKSNRTVCLGCCKKCTISPNFVIIFPSYGDIKGEHAVTKFCDFFWDSPNLVKNQVNYILQNFAKLNIIMYFHQI